MRLCTAERRCDNIITAHYHSAKARAKIIRRAPSMMASSIRWRPLTRGINITLFVIDFVIYAMRTKQFINVHSVNESMFFVIRRRVIGPYRPII